MAKEMTSGSSVNQQAVPMTGMVPRRSSPLADFVRLYRRNGGAVVALVVLALVILATIAAPVLSPADPVKMGVGPIFSAPTAALYFMAAH